MKCIMSWSLLTVLICIGAPAMQGCLDASSSGALVPPTADEDYALPQISMEIAGHTRAVHLTTYGVATQPVLLVLHGSLADHRALRPFQVLSERYFVVMWDQRGNGLSERITQEDLIEREEAITLSKQCSARGIHQRGVTITE